MVRWQNRVHPKSHLRSTGLRTIYLSQCCDVLSALFTEETRKNILRFSHISKDLELFIVLNQKQRANWFIVKILAISDGLQSIQPEEGTNVLALWVEEAVNLSVSLKDAGSELKEAIWSWTHFYMVLGRPAMCEITATIQLRSVIFALNVTRI